MSRHVVFGEQLFPAQERDSTSYPVRVHSPFSGTTPLLSHFYSINSLTISVNTSQDMPTTGLTTAGQITVESYVIVPTSLIMSPEILPVANINQTPSSKLYHDPTPDIPTSHVITKSMIGNSKPKAFPGFRLYL